MKNLKEINKELAEILKEGEEHRNDLDQKIYKRIQKRFTFLNTVKMYLEKSPRPEFCQSELDRVLKLKDHIENADLKDYTHKTIPDATWEQKRAGYRSEMRYSEVVLQIKALKCILS